MSWLSSCVVSSYYHKKKEKKKVHTSPITVMVQKSIWLQGFLVLLKKKGTHNSPMGIDDIMIDGINELKSYHVVRKWYQLM